MLEVLTCFGLLELPLITVSWCLWPRPISELTTHTRRWARQERHLPAERV